MPDRELQIDIETRDAERAIDRLIEKMESLLEKMDAGDVKFRASMGDGAGVTVGTGRGPVANFDASADRIIAALHETLGPEAQARNSRVQDWGRRGSAGGAPGEGRGAAGGGRADTLGKTADGYRWQSPAAQAGRSALGAFASSSPSEAGNAAGSAFGVMARGVGSMIGGFAGPAGAVVGELGEAIVGKIVQGGQDYVQHVESTMGVFMQAGALALGQVGASDVFRMVSPADDYGFGGAEAMQMMTSFGAASGRRGASASARSVARLKRLGIDEGTAGRFEGLGRYGRASTSGGNLEEIASVAMDAGLRPEVLVSPFVDALEKSAQRGGRVDGLMSADFVSRTFAQDRTGEGVSNARAFAGLEGLRSSGSNSVDAFYQDLSQTMMEARAYEEAAKTGKTGFAALNAVREATEGEGFGAEGNAAFLNAILGEEGTAGIAAVTGDTSVAAGRNAARAAGAASVRGSTTASDALAEMMLGEGYQAAIIKARSENITLGQGLGNMQVFKDLTTAARIMGEGSRSMAGAAADLQNFMIGLGIR